MYTPMDNLDPELARVEERQRELFPTSPLEVAARLDLRPSAMLRLFEEGLLSFDPQRIRALDPSQRAELTFLGALFVAVHEDVAVLLHLLAPLRAPYAYDLHRLTWDWHAQRWLGRDTRVPLDEDALDALIEAVSRRRDRGALHDVLDFAKAHGRSVELIRTWLIEREALEQRRRG